MKTKTQLHSLLSHKSKAKWVKCANENSRCNMPAGVYKMRFGKNTTWRTKLASGDVDCRNTNFGDPLVGTVKECWYYTHDYSKHHKKGKFAKCSDEHGSCKVTKGDILRFGQDGNGMGWLYFDEAAPGTIPCEDANLGDPLYGTFKQCQILHGGAVHKHHRKSKHHKKHRHGHGEGHHTHHDKGKWIKCADENNRCVLPADGVHTIRFGKNTTWRTKLSSGSIDCRNTNFGDPLVGTVKECWYNTYNYAKHHKGNFVKCSDEHGTCNVAKGDILRFGQTGTGSGWLYFAEAAAAAVKCEDANLGDPLYGTFKQCQIMHKTAHKKHHQEGN